MKLDYFIGRPFLGTLQNEEGELSEWAVRLEGGTLIANHDPERNFPPDLDVFQGTSLLAVNYTEEETVMQFGYSNPAGSQVIGEIYFTPELYSLSDPGYTGGEQVWPERKGEPEASLPSDPSAERVASGPEEPLEGLESLGAGQ